jgi:hypothetical protein
MFGSVSWNAGATLRQYPCRATGVPGQDVDRLRRQNRYEEYFYKSLKSRCGLP